MTEFHANGKLLLTAEYAVLDGVPALAVPTRRGQSLGASQQDPETPDLTWQSLLPDGTPWLEASLPLSPTQVPDPPEHIPTARLHQLLAVALELRPELRGELAGKRVTTRLEFPRDWGLGSSSTLLHLLGQWWGVDPFVLLDRTFGGSGYDVACAGVDQPIVFERRGAERKFEIISWRPAWRKQTYFVHLGRKQDSRAGIRRYRERGASAQQRQALAEITAALVKESLLLRQSKKLLAHHERIVSEMIGLPTVQSQLFADFPGVVKSLGAWGGDFAWFLPDGGVNVPEYCAARGYATCVPWEDMVLEGPASE